MISSLKCSDVHSAFIKYTEYFH